MANNQNTQRETPPPPTINMRPGGGRPGPRLTEKPKNTKKTLGRLLSYIGKSRVFKLGIKGIFYNSSLKIVIA